MGEDAGMILNGISIQKSANYVEKLLNEYSGAVYPAYPAVGNRQSVLAQTTVQESETVLEVSFTAFFNREPDTSGRSYWIYGWRGQ